MRVHLNSASAELNSKIQEEDGFIAITIFQSRIDTRCILDSPQGSIRSYRIDQIDQNVVIRIHSGGVHLFAKVYRELNSNDLLVHLIPNLQKTLQFAEANEAHRAGRRDKEKS
ncbi:hypothetical protein HQ496_02420 [bacterium]|nr:hypothetical protein [bacterium]